MESFNFKVDTEKCSSCGTCIKTCSSAILEFDDENHPFMPEEFDGIAGWYGCYRCQHCLAVCPKGAISILGKDPAASPLASEAMGAAELDALMRNRRACRTYKAQDVPRETIDEMLSLLENVPTGSNFQTLGFNVVYKKAEMDKFRKMVRDEAFRLADEGIYPGTLTKELFATQTNLEPKRNPGDMFFVNAPHILVIHSLKDRGQWKTDPIIAATWFDLICASRGLGSIIMSLPVATLARMPEVEKLLGLGEDRHYPLIVGFGYPEIAYKRGVQREGIAEIKELTF